jgi:DNA-binding CsgD family transcriptional regulator
MVDDERLRPVERRVLRWAQAGVDDAEIGHRFRRSERWAAQVRFLAGLDGRSASPARKDRLRPLERRVLRWREQGEDLVDLSDRFLRSPDHLARVEEFARYKLATAQ